MQRTFEDLVDPGQLSDVKAMFETIQQEKEAFLELDVLSKAGDRFPMEISCRLISYLGQLSILGVAKDLTRATQIHVGDVGKHQLKRIGSPLGLKMDLSVKPVSHRHAVIWKDVSPVDDVNLFDRAVVEMHGRFQQLIHVLLRSDLIVAVHVFPSFGFPTGWRKRGVLSGTDGLSVKTLRSAFSLHRIVHTNPFLSD